MVTTFAWLLTSMPFVQTSDLIVNSLLFYALVVTT